MTLELDRLTTAQFPPDPPTILGRAPSSTGVEQVIVQASRHDDAGEALAAERAYVQADAMMGGERSPRHAEVLICLALLLRRRGAVADAARQLDMALTIFPDHRAALTQRLALARELGDLATAAALRNRMLAFCESAEARVHVLTEVAADALDAAASALREAIALRPSDTELRRNLCSLLEATSDYHGAVNALVALAESLQEPKLRAREFARAARLCAGRCSNVDRSVALYEAAIADDPTVPGAFEAIEKVLLDVGDVEGTERAYARQIERLRDGGHHDAEAALLLKLARLREEQLLDIAGAIDALERAVALRPADTAVQLLLARVLDQHGSSQEALKCLEIVTELTPTDVAAYRQMQRIALNSNDYARAFFAASVLVHLGEADELEQAMYRRYALDGAPPVACPLDAIHLDRVRPATHPAQQLLLTIRDAAIAAKLSATKGSAMLPTLEDAEFVDPNTSTASAVRVVAWVARLLDLPPLALYVQPQQRFLVAHPMTARPAIILGAGMLSGRSIPELLFRAAYELGTQRELGRIPVFYPTVLELETLVAAAVGLCHPKHLSANAMALARALDAHLGDRERNELGLLVEAATRQGIAFDIYPMLRDIEITTARIGLIACTDVTVAARQMAMESRPTLGLPAADRTRDLLTFAVSKNHEDVRNYLGMSLGASQAQA